MSFDAGDANLYRYVGNHGTYATDPSGNVERGKSSTVPGLDKAIRSTGGFGSGQIIAKDETGLRFIDVDVNPFYLPSPNSNGSSPHSGNDFATFEVNVTENNTCRSLLVNWRLNCDGTLGDEGPASTQEIGKPFYVGQNPSGSMRATTDEEHARFRAQELQRLLAEHALAVEYRKQEQLNRLETELTREYPREWGAILRDRLLDATVDAAQAFVSGALQQQPELQSQYVSPYVTPRSSASGPSSAPRSIDFGKFQWKETEKAPKEAVENLPTVTFSSRTHRELAENIRHAQAAGHPSVLTHGGNAAANRAASLEGVPNNKPLSRDEYPFASSVEGGAGAWVGHVPASQQNSQGGILSNFFRRNQIKPGDKYQVNTD
jgi:hypothetical protein